MTNIMAGSLVLESTNAQPFTEIICDGGPIWPHVMLVTAVLLWAVGPIISIIVCSRTWRNYRQGIASLRAIRVILVMALLVFVFTVLSSLYSLQSVLILRSMMEPGEARGAMIAANLQHICWVLGVGVMAGAICLLCALFLPARRPTVERVSC